MNITITQDNSRVEVLGSNGASIIDKLYKLAIDPNNALTLEGNISSTAAYGYLVDYLNTNYGPDLIVNATNKWIYFEDPNVESYLASMNIGTDGKVSEALAAAVTSIANAANTTITKFNELRYFTNITEGKGGWTGTLTGNTKFLYWTSLEEIDISNFTSVGHDTFFGIEETFRGCSALRKVTASSNLFGIGRCAFSNCTNLEEISGLSGTITMFEGAFENCTKLTSDNFQNCSGFYFDVSGSNAFYRCTSLTTLPPLSGNLGASTCEGCSNLETIDLTGAATIGNNAFSYCTKLNCTISCPNLTGKLGSLAFRNTKITKVLDLGSCTSIGPTCFTECRSLTEVVLPSTCALLEEGVFYNAINLLSVNVENIVTLGRTVFGASSEYSFNDSLLYFKELCTIEQENNMSRNGLFETGCLYVYAPKLQACAGGFDAGGNEVRGLFVCSGYKNRMTDHNIVYFKDLSSVETGAFCGGNIRNLVINNTTPPTVTAHTGQKQNLLIDVSGNGVSRSVVQNVWVPDSAVNTYKADTYWGEFGNKIQGLSGFSKVATRDLWDLLSASAKADTLIEEYM